MCSWVFLFPHLFFSFFSSLSDHMGRLLLFVSLSAFVPFFSFLAKRPLLRIPFSARFGDGRKGLYLAALFNFFFSLPDLLLLSWKEEVSYGRALVALRGVVWWVQLTRQTWEGDSIRRCSARSCFVSVKIFFKLVQMRRRHEREEKLPVIFCGVGAEISECVVCSFP